MLSISFLLVFLTSMQGISSRCPFEVSGMRVDSVNVVTIENCIFLIYTCNLVLFFYVTVIIEDITSTASAGCLPLTTGICISSVFFFFSVSI